MFLLDASIAGYGGLLTTGEASLVPLQPNGFN
jgi:hypothetical protein